MCGLKFALSHCLLAYTTCLYYCASCDNNLTTIVCFTNFESFLLQGHLTRLESLVQQDKLPVYGDYFGADLQALDTENLFLFNEGSYSGLQAYKNSKAANIMFSYELARKLSGTGVKVNAVCPGKVIF